MKLSINKGFTGILFNYNVYFTGIQKTYLGSLNLASGKVIVIYVLLPIFKQLKKLV